MGTGWTAAHLTLVDCGSHILTETGTVRAPLPSCSLHSRITGVSSWTSDFTCGRDLMLLLAGLAVAVDEAERPATQLSGVGT